MHVLSIGRCRRRVGHPAPARCPGRSAEQSAPTGGSAAFTLVEVMIAVMLLAVGILALAQVFAVANNHTSFAREQTIATCLAEEIREKVMSENFDDIYAIFNGIDTDNPSSVPLPAEEWAGHLAAELGPFGRGLVEVETPQTDPTLAHGMLGVTVTIFWREAFGTVNLPLHFAIAKSGA